MKILVTGGRGQLGRSVVEVGCRAGHIVVAHGVDELDIRQGYAIDKTIVAFKPDLVINGAAYTAVDRAESERAAAFEVNRDAAGILARQCAFRNVRLLHVSTDYVFDGASTRPYREDDPIAPLGVYGESKAEGEQAVHAAGGVVVRTSWLFSTRGPSFVQTMLRLAAERPVLRVVADQHGCPTWAGDLAGALIVLGGQRTLAQTYHYCNSGVTTWHAFASAIIDEGRAHRSLACERIETITTADYPTPARRPAYSVLDTSKIRALGIIPPPWTLGLQRVIAEELKE